MSDDPRTHLPEGVKAETRYIVEPFVDLMTGSGIGTQALFGQRFDLIRDDKEIAYGALYSVLNSVERVDYIGTVPTAALSKKSHAPTHVVSSLVSAVFKRPDIKSKLLGSLPRNATVQGVVNGKFLELAQFGYIHLKHLRDVRVTSSRPYYDIATDMLGLPYIWGGTGGVGVDCSGLVQSALAATGVDAPRDTDQQESSLGKAVDFVDRRVGDLLFWPGHVGIVLEGDILLHANAYHMCVQVESVFSAVARIGAVRTVKRLSI